MAVSLSPLLAPALGGYIQHWFDWQGNFVFLAFFFGISLFFFGLFFPETNKYINVNAFLFKNIFINYKSLFSKKMFVGCTLLAGLVTAANFSFVTKSAFIIQNEYGIKPVLYGWLMSLTAIGGLISRGLGPYFLKKIGGRDVLFYSILILIFSGAILLFLYYIHWLNLISLLFFSWVYCVCARISYAFINGFSLGIFS